MDEEEYPGEGELVSRAPTPQDLANSNSADTTLAFQ